MALPTCECMPGIAPSINDKLALIYCAILEGGGATGSLLTGNTLWVDAVNGDNESAQAGSLSAKFATPEAAVEAASSGDTINVLPGEYEVESNIAKNGVSWFLYPGARITKVGSGNGALFDDSELGLNSAMSFSVGGWGTLETLSTGQEAQVFRLTNANSNVSVLAKELTTENTTNEGGDPTPITQEAGKIRVIADSIIGGGGESSGLWWVNGDMHVTAHRIVAQGRGLYDSVTATPTGEMFVKADYIAGGVGITSNSTEATARVWVDALEVVSTGENVASVDLQSSCIHYITTQKFMGGVSLSGTGERHIKADKVSSTGFGGSLLSVSNGNNRITIPLFDCAALVASPAVTHSGGTTRIYSATINNTIANAAAHGVNLSAGTLHLHSSGIGATASANPVLKSGGDLVIWAGCAFVAGGAQASISAPTAQSIKVYGESVANTALDVDVTEQVSSIAIDPDVTLV